jgi:hypothetical protein
VAGGVPEPAGPEAPARRAEKQNNRNPLTRMRTVAADIRRGDAAVDNILSDLDDAGSDRGRTNSFDARGPRAAFG